MESDDGTACISQVFVLWRMINKQLSEPMSYEIFVEGFLADIIDM